MKKKLLSRRDMMKLSLASLCGSLLLPSCQPLILGKHQEGLSSQGYVETPSEALGRSSGHAVRSQEVLEFDGILRSDIRPSLGIVSGSNFFLGTTTAGGLPLTIELQLRSIVEELPRALTGLGVYLWHCDREGLYSMYDQKICTETYLRGVQVTDGKGNVTFKTIFPGCTKGRMPHVYVEVYASFDDGPGELVKATQLTFPPRLCRYVYQSAGYAASLVNLSEMDFSRDEAFADGVVNQLFSMVGNYTTNYRATLSIDIDHAT